MCLPRCASGPCRLADPRAGPYISGPRLEVCFDGGSRGNPGVAGAGALLFWCNDFGRPLASSHWSFIGDGSTNNKAEYGGLLCELDGALSLLSMVPLGVCSLVQVFGDSELVTQQVKRAWRVRSPNLVPIFEQAISNMRVLRVRGSRVTFTQLPRASNSEADALVRR
jgi:ribonuclease HI